MAKGNDKKVVKHARETLLSAMGNLLESHRERRFRQAGKAQPRAAFCAQNGLMNATVAHIETGRFLGLTFAQLRHYLAVTHGKNSQAFVTSARTVYDGLKEMERLLREL
jgi:hypothetical protein